MTTQVILSHPIPPDEATSVAMILSKTSSMARDILSFLLLVIKSPTISTASWDVRQSQIPSQAIIRKAVSLPIFSFFIYGTAVIICSATPSDVSDLYSRSPRDLDRFSTPLTLLSSTNPPAISMRLFSSGSSGLWSTLISTALNFPVV